MHFDCHNLFCAPKVNKLQKGQHVSSLDAFQREKKKAKVAKCKICSTEISRGGSFPKTVTALI